MYKPHKIDNIEQFEYISQYTPIWHLKNGYTFMRIF